MTPAWRDPDSAADADDRMWGGRRWTAIAAVVFVTVVLVLVLVVLLARAHPARPGSGQPSTTGRGDRPTSSSRATGGTGSAGGEPLTAAPVGVAWQLVDGVALPFSAADGPRSTAGGVATGFSRTPAGALLACVQAALRIGAVNPAEQAAVVRAMVVGAGQAGLLASRPAAVPAVKPQLAGFRYVSFTPEQAVIGLAERVSDVSRGTARFVDVGELQLVWVGGDWRLLDDGSQPPLPTVLDAGLTGFVPFAGA